MRPSVRASVCTPFPNCDFATFCAKFLVWKLAILDENTRFCGSFLIWKSTMLNENTRICGSFPFWKATILDENTQFCGSFPDWKSTILNEKTRFCGSFPISKSNYFLFANRIIALNALVIQGMRPAHRAGLNGGSSLGQRPATLFIKLPKFVVH